eukprot:TRINITY_DN2417_c0_g1_i1.p1 TRINITY_DN2417_c0_g1~~TRINITY_DN2417_c0_g1_i1.p1  ORF type:complete len:187 (-),score=47.01 TRINITY_DN2417_c0_g1_i1:379-939(-)
MPEYKVVVVGSAGVGKSALTIQLIQNNFYADYDPTIEDSFRKDVLVDDEECTLDVLDTAGIETYRSMQEQGIKLGQGFLVIFAITSRDSFTQLQSYRDRIQRLKEGVAPMCLVGNKADLADERAVPKDEAEGLAKSWGVEYFETSAKTRQNVEEAFYHVVRMIREMVKEEPVVEKPKASGGCCVLC